MKPLNNHLILFDEECPMCSAYTGALVKMGMLEAGGRTSYQQVDAAVCPMVDRQRAVNEIALVDLETGKVSYGVRSLFELFASAIPFLRPLLLFGPFVWIMSKIYSFVAYNRRVIIPPPGSGTSYPLQPTFRPGYRIAYIIITVFLTAWLVNRYVLLVNSPLPIGDFLRVLMIVSGQVFVQAIVIQMVDREKTWAYLGNLMTINVFGALLLVPLLLFSAFMHLPIIVSVAYLIVIIILVFLEHFRRARLLKTGLIPVVTWALYTFYAVT